MMPEMARGHMFALLSRRLNLPRRAPPLPCTLNLFAHEWASLWSLRDKMIQCAGPWTLEWRNLHSCGMIVVRC